MKHRICCASLTFALVAAPVTADDLFVGPTGSGAEFLEIADALVAASPGDTIHVEAGTYDVFTVDLPVKVLGAGSASVEVQSSVSGAGIEVRDIPAAAEAVVSGMTLLEAPGGFAPFVTVEDNDGNVVLHDLVGTGVSGFGTAFLPRLVEIVDSENVVLERCSFTGEDSFSSTGGIPLEVDASDVWVVGSTLLAGASGLGAVTFEVLNGSHGIRVVNLGTVRVASSFVRGGLSGSYDSGVVIAGSGGAGIYIETGGAQIYGGPGNTLRGGDANPAGPPDSQPGFAFLTTALSSASYAADAVLEGGLSLEGVPGPPVPVATQGSVVPLSYARAVLGTSLTRVAPGGSFDVDYSGNPLSPVGTFVALGTGPFISLPDFDGALVVDLATVFVGVTTALDAIGLASATLPVPAQPGLAGTLVVFQSVELGAKEVSLSNPALVVIESP